VEERPTVERPSERPARRESEGPLSGIASEAEAELSTLRGGRVVRFLGSELPVRAVWALAVFLTAFMVVWLVLWAALGGVGLGLGWIAGAAAGLGAVRLYRHRAEPPRREHPPPAENRA
jgi:hypothetical protein